MGLNKPGIEIIYEQTIGLLEAQKETGAHLDTKATTILATATVVVGIGIPIGTGQIQPEAPTLTKLILLVIGLIPIGLYLLIFVNFYRAYRLKPYKTIDDPEEFEKAGVADLEQQTAMKSVIQSVKKQSKGNEEFNIIKRNCLKWNIILLGLETGVVVCWSFVIACLALFT